MRVRFSPRVDVRHTRAGGQLVFCWLFADHAAMTARLVVLALLLLGGCVTTDQRDPLPYGCSDLAVIGRVNTLSYTDIEEPPEFILGSVLRQTEVRIKRVVHGEEQRTVVRASAMSHAEIRNDVDLLIVLSTNGADAEYNIETLNVMPVSLAASCTSRPD